MGVRLMVEVLDHAPATLTPRERWALIAIAEDARDETRLCLRGVESNPTLARRMRAGRSERAAIIAALIAKGALERVKRGQMHQHAVFRIPPLAPAQDPETPAPEPPASVRETRTLDESQPPENPDAGDSQGPDSAGPGSGNCPPRVRETRTPSPQSPQDPSSLSAPERKIMGAVGATVDETREIISIIKTENRPRNLPAYVATLAENGDLAPLLERVRSGSRADAPPSTPTPPTVAERLTQQPCPHGMPGGHHPRPGSGTPACPQCRTGDTPPPPAVRPVPAPAAPRDLSSLRETLGSLTTRSGPRRPALNIRPRTAPETPPEVERAHATLARHGNALDLMKRAREKLGGDQVHRNEVVVLAAELARAGVSATAAGG